MSYKAKLSLVPALLAAFFGLSSLSSYVSAQIYWGAYITGASGNPTYPSDYADAPYDMRTVDRFETNAGKRISILHWGSAWKNRSGTYNTFPTSLAESVRQRGTIPMINWGSWQLGNGVNQPAFKLTNITRGDYDAYITQWARDAKAWNHPFFLRFNHEQNIGDQFSWNHVNVWTDPATGQTYSNTTADYINSWRHVVDIFRREGATNVTWVWCPNIYFRSGSKAVPFMQDYPGDNYVDWTCVDGYNKGTAWASFQQVFSDSYKVLQQQVTGADTACNSLVTAAQCNPKTKPMMIGEWGSREGGDGGAMKSQWLQDAHLTQLPNNYPGIKAIVWFNWNLGALEENVIESTATALAGFKTSIGSSYYAANNFANITTSPIAPPGGSTSATPSPPPSVTVTTGPTVPGQGTVTLQAIADTYIASDAPTINYGSSTTLIGDNNPIKKVFFKFDLSQLAGKTLTGAQLTFKTSTDPNSGSTGQFTLKRVYTTDWSEAFMTYNNTVPISSDVLAAVTSITTNAVNSVPLSASLVQPTAGSLFSLVIESASDDGIIINSSESADVPTLMVTYTGTSTPTTNPCAKAGDANCDGKVDGIDYMSWLNNYGKTVTQGVSVGDFNRDTKVDGVDYIIWLNNYGK